LGATGTFVTPSDTPHLHDVAAVQDGPTILSASGTNMPSTQQGVLRLSNKLSHSAQTAFVLDDLKTGTLVSLAQLCDDDCIAIFTKYDVKILKENQIIIKGKRMPNSLWSIPLTQKVLHQANGILRTDQPKQELATYLHAALGSPAPSSLLRAICRGHLTTIPGLTINLISKFLPKSLATVLCHQDQEAKILRSTKHGSPELPTPPFDIDLEPPLDEKSHQLCAMLIAKHDIIKS
jgi:hypothetical protein